MSPDQVEHIFALAMGFAVAGLVCAIQGNADELSVNFLRLYDFVTRQLRQATLSGLAAAKRVLQTLREGFEASRPEAVRLEREGIIPPLERPLSVQKMA